MSTRPIPKSLQNVSIGETPPLPTFGLCGVRSEHNPHDVTEGSLAPFFCTADQSEREPGRSERRRAVVETQVRLLPPMDMRLTGCEAQWVEDVWAGRRHEHRERA